MQSNEDTGHAQADETAFKKAPQNSEKILKNTFSEIRKSFVEGSDRLADICLNDTPEGKKNKLKNVTNETISIFNDIGSTTKNNFKKLMVNRVINDTSFGVGKASGKISNTSRGLFKNAIGDNAMQDKNKKILQNLGQNFYEWHKDKKLNFVYGTDSQNLEMEIERISELIEYVKVKKESLIEQ